MKHSAKVLVVLMVSSLAISGCGANTDTSSSSISDTTTVSESSEVSVTTKEEESVKEEEKTENNKVFPDNAYNDMPSGFKKEATKHGTFEVFNYTAKTDTGEEYEKTAMVYLPYGYDAEDKETKYNVLYLMHGGGDDETRYWGRAGLEKVLDSMFEKGNCEPFIVVTPNYRIPGCDETASAKNFYKELRGYLIPAFESQHNTYAEDTTPDGIKASRMHRAYGGFSMGACSVWAVFENCLDEIAYYMPVSGDCWSVGGSGEKKAEYLAEKVKEQGYTADDFYMYAGCGNTGDMAYPNMVPQLDAMRELSDTFVYCDNFADGNFYYYPFISSGHSIPTVNSTIYNALPKFFIERNDGDN